LQNNNSNAYKNYLSTTMTAKGYGIVDSKKFIDYLVSFYCDFFSQSQKIEKRSQSFLANILSS